MLTLLKFDDEIHDEHQCRYEYNQHDDCRYDEEERSALTKVALAIIPVLDAKARLNNANQHAAEGYRLWLVVFRLLI